MTAYYNEIEPSAVAWLRDLIKRGLIADGIVDDRSIEDVQPDDLKGFTQCHFFAGIGGWSLALRMAGWADDRPVWTGSCPCQPFSDAGKGKGLSDERHLWPAVYRLIKECAPDVVFGEQVASKDALGWLDVVRADLEGSDYAVGAIDTCAASVGAFHIRQRLYWVADRAIYRREQVGQDLGGGTERGIAQGVEQRPAGGGSRDVANAHQEQRYGTWGVGPGRGLEPADSGASTSSMADTNGRGRTPGTQGFEQGHGSGGGPAIELESDSSANGPVVDASGSGCGPLDRERNESARSQVPVGGSSLPGSRLGNTSGSGGGRDTGTIPGAQAPCGVERALTGHLPDQPIASSTAAGTVVHPSSPGSPVGRDQRSDPGQELPPAERASGGIVSVADPGLQRRPESSLYIRSTGQDQATPLERGASLWSSCDWYPCADGRKRPAQSGIQPLAARVPDRVVRVCPACLCAGILDDDARHQVQAQEHDQDTSLEGVCVCVGSAASMAPMCTLQCSGRIGCRSCTGRVIRSCLSKRPTSSGRTWT